MQITPGICDSGCFCSVISRGKSPLVSAFLGVSFWALPGRFWMPLFGHPPEANHPCNLIPAASFWVPIFDHFWRQIPPNICDLASILRATLDQFWEQPPPGSAIWWVSLFSSVSSPSLPSLFGSKSPPVSAIECVSLDPFWTNSGRQITPRICDLVGLFLKKCCFTKRSCNFKPETS